VRRTSVLDVVRVAQLRLLLADLHQQLDGCFRCVADGDAFVGRPRGAELLLGVGARGSNCSSSSLSGSSIFGLVPFALSFDDPICR